MNFLKELIGYDKDNIPPVAVQKLKKEFLTNPEFIPEKVAKASSAAQGLCSWCLAMVKYDEVKKIVAPKEASLAQAEAELAVLNAALAEKQEQLRLVESRLEDLNSNLRMTTDKMQYLEREVDLCGKKLIRAQKLISGLGGEKQRWTQAAEDLQKINDSLLGSTFFQNNSCFTIQAFKLFQVMFCFRLVSLATWDHSPHSSETNASKTGSSTPNRSR